MPTIYIMDYDADILFVLSQWLERNGFKTKGFLTPDQLLARFEVGMPDCIIIDTLYGGLRATREMCNLIQNRFDYKGKVLLSTTGKISEKERQACDAIDFIHKPFDLWEVLEVVNKAFDDSFANNA
jgi:FixJ family two-component response regulator